MFPDFGRFLRICRHTCAALHQIGTPKLSKKSFWLGRFMGY